MENLFTVDSIRSAKRKTDAFRVELHADDLPIFVNEAFTDIIIVIAGGDKAGSEVVNGLVVCTVYREFLAVEFFEERMAGGN